MVNFTKIYKIKFHKMLAYNPFDTKQKKNLDSFYYIKSTHYICREFLSIEKLLN